MRENKIRVVSQAWHNTRVIEDALQTSVPELSFSFTRDEEPDDVQGQNDWQVEGNSAFTINMISRNKADIAIFNFQTLPYPLPHGLKVAAVYISGLHPGINNGGNRLEQEFALVTRDHDKLLEGYLSRIDSRHRWGKVAIAGFGPGNPELITMMALQSLKEADVIFYDDLIDVPYLDNFPAEKIYVGKRSSRHSFSQEAINGMLYKMATSGKNVARIKGGDPLIFGRGIEEYHYLKARQVNVRLIPGVSSAMAAAADALVPLTARGLSSSVAFLTAHDMEKLSVPRAETLVFFMAASHQNRLASRLISEGWSENTPVAIIQNASRPESVKRRYTLGSLSVASNTLESPLVIIVGWTAAGQDTPKPKRWLFTGTSTADFKEQGIMVHSPFSKNYPLKHHETDHSILNNIKKFDQVWFTDRQAVENFFHVLLENGFDARDLGGKNIVAADETASTALKSYGILAIPLREIYSTFNIDNTIKTWANHGKHVLIPGGEHEQRTICSYAKEAGLMVTNWQVYKTEKIKNLSLHDLASFNGVIFTSANSVNRFVEVYGNPPGHLKLVFSGPCIKQEFNNMARKLVNNHGECNARDEMHRDPLSRVIEIDSYQLTT